MEEISFNVGSLLSILAIASIFLYAYGVYYRLMFLHEKEKNSTLLEIQSGVIATGLYLVSLVNRERSDFNNVMRILENEKQSVNGDLDIPAGKSLGKWLAEKNVTIKTDHRRQIDTEKFTKAFKENEETFSKNFND